MGIRTYVIKGHIWVQTGEVKRDKEDNLREIRTETLFIKQNLVQVLHGEGNLWKYLWFCIKTSI